jgi:hypothetical protein
MLWLRRVDRVVDEEVLQFIERNKAAKTMRKTRSDLNIWSRWCSTVSLIIIGTKFTMRISSIE